MEQHHHQPHHHLHGHSGRYATLPPQPPPAAPLFLDPDLYRRPPHLSLPPQPPPRPLPPPPAAHHPHRPQDTGGLVYVSYGPSSSHASDHGRFLVSADPTVERLVLKPPHPAVPVPRVSDRIIFPEGHPEAPRMHHPNRRSGGVEVFVREEFKRERVRAVDEGPGGIILYGRREGEVVELGEQEEVAMRLGLLGRKRPRWEEGRVLREDSSLECFEGRDPRRLSSGASTSRRRGDVLYEPRSGDAESSRGSTYVFASERGETVLSFPRPPAELPLRSPSGYPVSKLELLEKRPMMESETLASGSSHGFRERHVTSRGKRNVFAGEEEHYTMPNKAPLQKPSVLSRIQFAKPVYRRRHDEQIIPSASPLPVPHISSVSESDRYEMDGPVELDVSFKSDVLVAKEVVPSQVSALPRSIGEVCGSRATKKNVAEDTSVLPSTSFSKSDRMVPAMLTHELKTREERFAHSNLDGKPNRERTPKNKVASKVLSSANNVVRNFDHEVTGLRTPRNKVSNEVSISPNPVQNSTVRVSSVSKTENKMASPAAGVRNQDGKVTSTMSPKRKLVKDTLSPQNDSMKNPNDRLPTLKNLKGLSCDGIITTERCSEEKSAGDILVNSTDAGSDVGETINSTVSTEKLEKETLAPQNAVSLHCNEKVASVNYLKKEGVDNVSFPSVPVVPNAEEKTVVERPEKKLGKDTTISESAVVSPDKKVTTMRTIKKKIIKRNKKKKVIASTAPCLPSLDPPVEICKEYVPTNIPLEHISPSKEVQSGSTMACSHMEQKYLEEGKKDMKYSEIVQKVSPSDSSCDVLKHLEDIHAKFVSRYPEGMASTTGRSLKRLTKRKDSGEFTLIPCALDSCPMQEICERNLLNSFDENPTHSKEVQGESLSNCFQKDLNCSEETHKDTLHNEVHQVTLDAGEVHSTPIPASSCEDVRHLENVHDGSTQITACMDADFQGKGQEQHILPSCHDDVTHPVLLGKAETSDDGKLGVDNSTLELHSQGVMLPEHLEINTVEAPSNVVVPVEVDINESPREKYSIENAVENFRSSIQQEECTGESVVNFREGPGSGKHLSALKETFLPDTIYGEKVHNEGMPFFDGERSLKADITGNSNKGGQKLLPRPKSSDVLEEFEMASSEKDAATGLHCPMQERSVLLQAEAQTSNPELGKEGKQKQPPSREAILTENRLGEVGSENNIVGGERSRELHENVLPLPMEAKDSVFDCNLLMGTNGREGAVLHLPFMDVFPESSSSAVGVECPIANSMAEQIADRVHSSPHSVSEKNSLEDVVTISEGMHLSEVKQRACDPLDDSCRGDSFVGNLFGDSNSKKDYLSDSKTLPVSELKISGKSESINLSNYLVSGKAPPQHTQEAEKQLNKDHQLMGKEELTGMKMCQRPGISNMYPNQKTTRPFKKPPSHGIRRNTWHRTVNPPISSSPGQTKWPSGASLPRQSPKKLGKTQSSYIRKGNSLIRKSSPVIPSSHPYPEQPSLDKIPVAEANKNMSVGDKIVSTDHLSFSSARTLNSSFETPKTPPLPLSTKPTNPSLNCPQTSTEDPLSEPGGEENAIPFVEIQYSDLNEENHSIIVAEESKGLGEKTLIYVKHKSNQLIAAPGTDANNTSVRTTEENPALPSAPADLYYRNKNTLIRDTSSRGQLKQETSLPKYCSDAKGHGPSKMPFIKGGAKVPRKARLEKAMEKTYKRSRFSLVWTLNGTQSQNIKCSNGLKHGKVLPYIFPWKRTYWRDIVTKMGSNLNKHSSSLISKKLQISRQRDTIYTISNGGFSLRKSGILGVGGSNLKWSKSMERRSRKASEEVTLSIVEQEKKKRKEKGTTCTDLTLKSGNCSKRKLALGIQLHRGERIFRVGTVHYKMDSSRRTLVRIPDEQTPAITNSQSVRGAKMPIVPRRLLIDNDEYVRVGNGNQLVRDPKKLVRILANEKIRWSLHTARQRSVRKQQYCQFFTRFGKCNKEDGKCPYIHDPTKVAICTKFLKGLCSSPNCKLTHKVLPERMPDCSYFLQGLCTNMSCPYRHVNVNPKASVCEGFLKGYCRDGDECRKKHSYACPHFEESGECPQGSACKLHHPKRAKKQANKSRKRKRSPIHDHGRGRYFGCSVSDVGETEVFASNMDTQKRDDDIFFHGGRFAEYISLDVDTGDAVEVNDLLDSHPFMIESDLSDSQSSDADAVIKPVRIMNMDRR